ncbi:MAG: zinc ABC transporter substrate-binding protein [Thermomicrobiales bacterium]
MLSRRTVNRSLYAAALATPLSSLLASSARAQEGDKVRVTATVGMIADAARNIGGDLVDVVALMGPGVDPHVYKPSAGDVGRLDRAEVIFYGGLELEGRMTDIFEKIAQSGKPAYAVTEQIPVDQLLALVGHSNLYDPHLWFDVRLWKQAVESVAVHLTAYAPEHTAAFRLNADAYLQQLDELDLYVEQQTSTIDELQRVLITAHDAFGYFGRRYGYEVRGVQGISTASEAGTRDIQDLVDFIVERQIPAMFVESSVSPTTIEAVQAASRDRGWNVAVGGELFSDAMGQGGTPEGTYIGMVTSNIDTISAALRGEIEDEEA